MYGVQELFNLVTQRPITGFELFGLDIRNKSHEEIRKLCQQYIQKVLDSTEGAKIKPLSNSVSVSKLDKRSPTPPPTEKATEVGVAILAPVGVQGTPPVNILCPIVREREQNLELTSTDEEAVKKKMDEIKPNEHEALFEFDEDEKKP